MDPETAAPAADETRQLQLVTREATIRADTFNETDNTVEIVWTTGARGTRMDWRRYELVEEELSTDAAHVRLDRINNGGPVLNSHRSYDLSSQLGVVVDGTARMSGGEGVATVRFSRRADIAPIIQDIRDQVIRNISVGYRVHEYEITEREGERPLYRAVDWEPYEISFVTVPFDAGAQTRSSEPAQGGFPCIFRRNSPASSQERTMDPEDQAGSQSSDTTSTTTTTDQSTDGQQQQRQAPAIVDATAVLTAARNAGLDADAREELLVRHSTTPFNRDTLMADIGRRFAERDSSAQTVNRVSPTVGNGATMVRAMSDAVFHRMAPGSQLPDAARQFRGMGLLRMAEELIGSSGVSTRGMTPHEIAERALHTTSDFPALMSNAMGRRLRNSYEEHEPTYRQWARRAPNAPNFKSVDTVQLSAMPDLMKVNEKGEFRYGTFTDGKVSYALTNYGRIIGLSRQLIINDDLNALDRILSGFAASAARLENRTVYAQLTANAVMPDGIALFHADHGNLGAAAAISANSLSAARTRMRKQKGLQNELLNLAPQHLIVPTDIEQVAYQFTSSQFVPARSADVNEFRQGGRTALTPIVEPLLDETSTSAFYLAASNSQIDTVEYAYLEGAEGVQLSSRVGFTMDGVEMKASLDFAAAVIDHRGLDRTGG